MAISTLQVPDYSKRGVQLLDSNAGGVGVQAPKWDANAPLDTNSLYSQYGDPAQQLQVAEAHSPLAIGQGSNTVPNASSNVSAAPVSGWENLGSTAATIGSAVLSNLSQTRSGYAAQRFQTDVETAAREQAAQFGPTTGMTPQFVAPPSKRDELSSSTWLGGKTGERTGAGEVTALLWNPAGEIGNAEQRKAGAYIGEKAMQGALESSGGGPIGTILGGVLGALQGVFGWSSAESEDKASQAKAHREYEQELMQWTMARNQQLAEASIRRNQEILAQRKQSKKEEKTLQLETQATTKQSVEQRRQKMWNALMSASSMQSNRQQQLAAAPY
jgi:hypothetical protein